MAAGRPTEYKSEFANQIYNVIKIKGITPDEACYFFNVSFDTLSHWVHTEQGFRTAIENGLNDRKSYLKRVYLEKEIRRKRRSLPHNRIKASNYIKHRRKIDGKFRLRQNFASLMRTRLKSKKPGVFKHLNYSLDDLVVHLESKFRDAMTWDNYGHHWHIDHIKPDKLFDYKSHDDIGFKNCWSLKNLQPLLAHENLAKGSKYGGA